MKTISYIFISVLAVLMIGCAPRPRDVNQMQALPEIYPDYIDATVPVNIAPLNFMLTDHYDAMQVTVSEGANELKAKCMGNEAMFDTKKWHKILQNAAGSTLKIHVTARKDGKWYGFMPFSINVSPDSIDPYLTYRLIEPDYEVFSRLQIQERSLEDFEVHTLCDHNMVGNRCMNCHTFSQSGGDRSYMYVRGEGGGMILNEGGTLRKLGLRTDDMSSGSVYAQFSPSGRYLVFSTNVIIPAFHSDPAKRLEVFDTKSDIYVADLQTDRIIRSTLLADSMRLETFPTFSPDGKSIYYCVADRLKRVTDLMDLQYSLCRIDFDESTGTIGTQVDTVLHAQRGTKSSVCHPRVSPDGKFILYTVADYGTFPIWHRESDQQMLDLTDGTVFLLDEVNSQLSDTYHSWSSNGRWFVMASKREDGLYGRPYICHVSSDGSVSKPFVVPQYRPSHYKNSLKSYNAPELGKSPSMIDPYDVTKVMAQPAETFR